MSRNYTDNLRFENKGYPDEIIGTRYLCVDGKHKGKFVTLFKQDNSRCPGFSVDGDSEDYTYIYWRDLQRITYIKSEEIMDKQVSDFRDQAYPKEKVGTKYLCLNGEFEGKEVTLSINDKSSCPYFHIEEDTDRNRVINWCDLKRIDSPKQIPIFENSEGFESKPYPYEVVGTKYIICKKNDYFPLWSTVKLHRNDKSISPLFKQGGEEWVEN